MDLGDLAQLIGAIVTAVTALYAAWKFLKRQAREDIRNEEARKAVTSKNDELAKEKALTAEKDRTIAELMALLEQATRPEGQR